MATAIVSEDLTGDRGSVFQATWLLIGNLPDGPLHKAAHYMCSLRTNDPRVRMYPNCMLWSFYNLILKIAYCHYYHILFIRSKTLCLAHIQMEKHQRIYGHIFRTIKGYLCPLAINYLHFFHVQNTLILSQGLILLKHQLKVQGITI